MQHTFALLALVGATFAVPQTYNTATTSEPGSADYFQAVCTPSNATGYPDFNAPCNAVIAVLYECVYGGDYLTAAFGNSHDGQRRRGLFTRQSDDGSDEGPPLQSNATQRACICESQFFAQVNGCDACYKAHGAPDEDDDLDSDPVASVSSSYCAASTTPTMGALNLFDGLESSYSATATATATASSTARFTDPLGNRTQVSLYYTASVTGSAAYILSMPTGTAAVYTSLNVVDGQIQATASQNNAAAGTASPAKTPSSTGAAMRTQAAIAGVVGAAGLLALW